MRVIFFNFTRAYFLSMLLFLQIGVVAQKENCNVLMGERPYWFNFCNNVIVPKYSNRNVDFFFTRPSISDSMGKLLFFSNGCSVFDKTNHYMKGGDTLSASINSLNQYWLGMPYSQGGIILPMPDSIGKYFLFYLDDNGTQGLPLYFQPTALFYAVIDMKRNGGLGEVIQKNKLILQDTLSDSRMAACKHANGRDWWLIKPEYLTNKYYKFLIDPSGVHGPYEQMVGGTFREPDFGGQANFSQDGSQFANATLKSNIEIFDFDRCTGEFSNPRSLIVPYDSNGWSGDGAIGVIFSPNGNYLYANSRTAFVQYDLTALDIQKTQNIFASVDTDYYFNESNIQADNKIYNGNTGFGRTLFGVVSNLNQDTGKVNFKFNSFGIVDPSFNAIEVPYFPNYHLGTSLVYADSVNAGLDTVICAGEYLKIGGVNYRNIRYHWQAASGAWSSDSCNPVVSPLETTTYYVRISDKYIDSSCALKYDTVTVTVKDQCPTVRFPSFIDKAKQPLFVVQPLTVGSSLTLYNSIGQKIYQQANYNNDFSTQNLPNGVYIYNYVNGGDGKQFRGKVEVME